MSDRVNRLSPRWQMALAMLTLYIVWGSTYLAIRVTVAATAWLLP